MYQCRISQLVTNDGTEIQPKPLTLIIGPNNAGKSRLLKDLQARIAGPPGQRFFVLKSAEIAKPSSPREFLEAYPVSQQTEANALSIRVRGLNATLTNEHNATFSIEQLSENVFEPVKAGTAPPRFPFRHFESTLGPFLVGLLSAENRLLLAKLRKVNPPGFRESLLFTLYEAGLEKDKAISKEVYRVFKKNVQLDYSALDSLCIRVAEAFKDEVLDARSSREFLKDSDLLDDQGDGLRSFTSVVIAKHVAPRPIWLVDEPEAFLHPPQAYQMGELLAEWSKRECQLFVASHSADILRGILAKTTDVTIIRLTREGDTNPCKVLLANRLKEILGNPLLSSSRVLDGLFYAAAVVTEADADNRLYQTISTKLSPGSDVHFVNAANKQTVPRIVKLYNDMNVRCIGVTDFDVINDASEFRNHLTELGTEDPDLSRAVALQKEVLAAAHSVQKPNVSAEVTDKLCVLGSKVNEALKGTGNQSDRDVYQAMLGLARDIAEKANPFQQFKQFGRTRLPAEAQGNFDELDALCRKWGLLINPHGQLESMLTDYDIEYSANKKAWIAAALKQLRHFQRDDTKIVWQFMSELHNQIDVHVQASISD